MNINCNKMRCLLFLFRCFFQDQSTLTTKKWIIPVLFLFFSFFWTTLEQGRKETNYRFLEEERMVPSNLEYKCERSQSWKFKMRHRRIDPPKNTLKARSYVIRDIYRRKEKKEEEEKTSWSRSKPIEIKGICARSPPINNFAGVHQRPERKKNGRGKERKRKKKKKWSRRHSGLLLRSNIYSAASTYYATRDSIARSTGRRVEPPPRSDLDDRSSSELMEPPLCIKRGPLYNYYYPLPSLFWYSKIPSVGSRERWTSTRIPTLKYRERESREKRGGRREESRRRRVGR